MQGSSFSLNIFVPPEDDDDKKVEQEEKVNLPAFVKVTVSGTRRRLDISPGSGEFFFYTNFFLGIVVDVRTLNKLMRQDLPNPDPFIRLRPKSRGTGFLRNICVRSK